MSPRKLSTSDAVAIGGNLLIAVGRVARRIKQLYEEGEATFSETSVLSRLGRVGSSTPGELATAEHVRPQAIVSILNELERRGMIRRTPDRSDGRKVVVTSTAAGREVLAGKGRRVSGAIGRVLGESFTPDELRQLNASTELLNRLADSL
jgi:DNA-binding MarR family transcriptional regulator